MSILNIGQMKRFICFLYLQGNVESWLGALLKTSLRSVHAVIRQASVTIRDPAFKLTEFLDTFPAQVLA